MISDLRPPILDQSGIVAAIKYLVEEGHGNGGLTIEFRHDTQIEHEDLAAPLEGAIFRIVQESLTNAAKYSQSETVLVELRQRGKHIHLEISDQGIGFDPAKVTEKQFGLRGMRERVRLLGGRVNIETAPGQGTKIAVELPLLEKVAGMDG